jgi:hypothetical protein
LKKKAPKVVVLPPEPHEWTEVQEAQCLRAMMQFRDRIDVELASAPGYETECMLRRMRDQLHASLDQILGPRHPAIGRFFP